MVVNAIRAERARRGLARGEGIIGDAGDEDSGGDAASGDRLAVVALARARAARCRAARDTSITPEIAAQATLIRTIQRGITSTSVAWDRLLQQSGVGEHLMAAARVRSFRRGVLTIQVRDASARYELGRLLRAGGEQRLSRLSPAPVHRVKLVP